MRSGTQWGRRFAAVVGLLWVLGPAGVRAGQDVTVTNFGEMEPVVFDHTSHAESHGCDTCHHPKSSGGAHRCGSCHRAQDTKAGMKFEDAAHKEGVGRCWGCHLKKGARKALECEQCHRGTSE
ncbi:MAG: cytochrome c3 family protein [Deltaproteobacteria bacterium]|nr:cytochrome c3 family protein [Deltaproteobacteria bacterium]